MLLDTLGAMIRASSKRYQAGNILSKFAKEQGGKPLASIIQRGFKTNLVNAALVNGTFGYYCDVESHHVEAVAHVAAVIVPTSLALSEAYQLTGKDLLTALVVGYDIETRVSNALDPTQLYKKRVSSFMHCRSFWSRRRRRKPAQTRPRKAKDGIWSRRLSSIRTVSMGYGSN